MGDTFGWREHRLLQGDGRGGYLVHPAAYQFVPRWNGIKVLPFGIIAMDNGELLLMGAARTGDGPSVYGETVQARSADGGATWSPYEAVGYGPAVGLTSIGAGRLFRAGHHPEQGPVRCFSHDYGRTWPEWVPAPLAPNGHPWSNEGNALVDFGPDGKAELIGWNSGHRSEGVEGKPFGTWPSRAFLCWSRDGGRTVEDYTYPNEWNWTDTWEGETWARSCSEGAMVRAANGWLVAAKRLDVSARFIRHHYDSFMGTGTSVSKDEGSTWTPISQVFEAGRHHANLQRRPNGDILLTVVRRLDIRGGELASYRLGCDAVVSRDHGLTWETDRAYILDDWPHIHYPDLGAVTGETGDFWYGCANGHQSSTTLDDGAILTTYGHYTHGGALIKWRPSGN